jgi:hypothetical protein
MDWKETLDFVFELDESVVIVIGYCDVVDKQFVNLTQDSFWRILGRGDDKEVYEALLDFDFNSPPIGTTGQFVDGEYQFKAVLKWESAEYHENRMVYPSYLYVDYMDAQLIRTIQQREREDKIDQTLDLGFIDNLL